MHTPPFEASGLAAALSDRPAPGSGAGAAASVPGLRLPPADTDNRPAPPAAVPSRRRARLAELDPHLHCSLIGTCLGTAELRRLVPRFADLDRDRASELDVHHAAVALASSGGAGAKALNKLLDTRYAAAIRHFVRADGEQALAALWSDALHSGEVPGAYWAAMTHPLSTPALRQRVFGEVHMLSHLVGAANRADIRRLVALERENAELKDRVGRQQDRLREAGLEHRETIGRLSRQLTELTGRLRREDSSGMDAPAAEVARLRQKLHGCEQQVALHTSRREQAEQDAAVSAAEVQRLSAELAHGAALTESLLREVHALERQLQAEAQPARVGSALAAWAGRRVLYVGGRPSTNAMIKALCERAGVELVLHDGGIEDRKGLLPAAIPGSALVLFPVDCVDHDSMNRLKKLCARLDVPAKPLRTAGIACVVSALSEAMLSGTQGGNGRLGPICRRHG